MNHNNKYQLLTQVTTVVYPLWPAGTQPSININPPNYDVQTVTVGVGKFNIQKQIIPVSISFQFIVDGNVQCSCQTPYFTQFPTNTSIWKPDLMSPQLQQASVLNYNSLITNSNAGAGSAQTTGSVNWFVDVDNIDWDPNWFGLGQNTFLLFLPTFDGSIVGVSTALGGAVISVKWGITYLEKNP